MADSAPILPISDQSNEEVLKYTKKTAEYSEEISKNVKAANKKPAEKDKRNKSTDVFYKSFQDRFKAWKDTDKDSKKNNIFTMMKTGLKGLYDIGKKTWKSIKDSANFWLDLLLLLGALAIFDPNGGFITSLIGFLTDAFLWVISALGKYLPVIVGTMIKLVPKIASAIYTAVLRLADGLSDMFTSWAKKLPKGSFLRGLLDFMGWLFGKEGTIQKVITAIGQFFKDLFDPNKSIFQAIGGLISGIAGAFWGLLSKIGEMVWGWFTKLSGPMQAVAIAVGALVGWFIALEAATIANNIATKLKVFWESESTVATIARNIVMGIGTALTWASEAAQIAYNFVLLLNPITWIILGIVAVITVVVVLFKKFWPQISGFFKKIWEGFVNMLKGIWDWIKSLPGKIWDAIKGIGESMGNLGKSIWEGLKSGLGKVGDLFMEYLIDPIVNLFKSAWLGIKAGLSSEAFTGSDASHAQAASISKKLGVEDFASEFALKEYARSLGTAGGDKTKALEDVKKKIQEKYSRPEEAETQKRLIEFAEKNLAALGEASTTVLRASGGVFSHEATTKLLESINSNLKVKPEPQAAIATPNTNALGDKSSKK
jgi:uncharacterized membrane protein